MKSNEITLEKKDSIATLKFNRPEAFNAVNQNFQTIFGCFFPKTCERDIFFSS